jgi:hypothetical protein
MDKFRFFLLFATAALGAQTAGAPVVSSGWRLLSSDTGHLERPFPGTQQTASAVFDINGDGVNDFVLTERTAAPSVVGYVRQAEGWRRIVIDDGIRLIEAGATFGDVDGDGDLDFLAGGEGRSNEIWWYENPGPALDAARPWIRRTIKRSGGRKHHDLLWADVDGDGRPELAFWNQGAQRLMLARPPANVKSDEEWPLTTVYVYSADSETRQRGDPPKWRRTNEHEGLTFADIDLDGKPDLVGGGLWFKHLGGDRFLPNDIDAAFHFSRSAVGQLKAGGRPEVALSIGDGTGPLLWYEWAKGAWVPHHLADVDNAHSLAIVDFNRDGHQDVFVAEMRISGGNPEAKTWIFLGDGQGGFRREVVATGLDNHESRIADLTGNGRLDILVKPYNHGTPAVHVLLNEGSQE